MDNLNVVLLEGNVSRLPKVHTSLNSHDKACTFSIGVNKSYKINGEKKEEVSYFEILVYNELIDICTKYLTMGKEVRISGELKQHRYNNSDGEPRERIRVKAFKVDLGADRKHKNIDEEKIFGDPSAVNESPPAELDLF